MNYTYNHIHAVIKNGAAIHFNTSFKETGAQNDSASNYPASVITTTYSYDCSKGYACRLSPKVIHERLYSYQRSQLEEDPSSSEIAAKISSEDVAVRCVSVDPQNPLLSKFRLQPKAIEPQHIKAGDHLFYISRQGAIEHHAIAITDIAGHSGRRDEDPLQGAIQVVHFDGATVDSAEVKLSSLNDYFRGKKRQIYVVRYEPEIRKVAAICIEALRAIGTKGFNRFSYNCEHLATFCKTKVAFSLQVYRITLMSSEQQQEAIKIIKKGPKAIEDDVAAGGVTSLIAPPVQEEVEELDEVVDQTPDQTADQVTDQVTDLAASKRPSLLKKIVAIISDESEKNLTPIERYLNRQSTTNRAISNSLSIIAGQGSALNLTSPLPTAITSTIPKISRSLSIGNYRIVNTGLIYHPQTGLRLQLTLNTPLVGASSNLFNLVGSVLARSLKAKNPIEGALIGLAGGASTALAIGASTGGGAGVVASAAMSGASGGASS